MEVQVLFTGKIIQVSREKAFWLIPFSGDENFNDIEVFGEAYYIKNGIKGSEVTDFRIINTTPSVYSLLFFP